MGKLEDALADAGQESGETAGGGLGTGNQGGAELQKGDSGATAEEQIAGQGTLPDQEGSGQERRTMPTDSETTEG